MRSFIGRHRSRVSTTATVLLAALAGALWWSRSDAGSVVGPGPRIVRIRVDSPGVGGRLPVSVVVAPGVRPEKRSALLVFLHGRGSNERSYLNGAFLGALAALRGRAPIVAFPAGGDHSYWHDRRGGAWGRYVVGELIPALTRRFAIDPSRVAVGGISMGGFGAFDLARLNPGRFCAVGGHSPALWQSFRETADGAFDDTADFARHDVIRAVRRHPSRLSSAALWLDAGDQDPFRAGDRALVAGLREGGVRITARIWPGGHDGRYWNSHWRSYLSFYAAALSHCHSG